MKKGLVMEGGSMRGIFTAGVIDVFMENGIEFDGAIGTSAGAAFGCNIKSKQIGRVVRYNTNYVNRPEMGTFKSFLKTGDFFEAKFCYEDIPNELDIFDTKTFAENPMEFFVVATNVKTGEAAYHRCSDGGAHDVEWMRASASIPLLSRIVELDGYKLLDGGIADSVPLDYFESIGYDRNVVILTQPDDYRKKKNKMAVLCKLIYRKYPEFVKAFSNRHIRYNKCIEDIRNKESLDKVFVIRPPEKLDIKSAEKDTDKIWAVYEVGRRAGLEAINERGLKKWLEAYK